MKGHLRPEQTCEWCNNEASMRDIYSDRSEQLATTVTEVHKYKGTESHSIYLSKDKL